MQWLQDLASDDLDDRALCERAPIGVQGAEPFAHALTEGQCLCALFHFSDVAMDGHFFALDGPSTFAWMEVSPTMEQAMETKHLHDQIARVTARLAHLHARDLVARHRLEARAQEATRKREAKRRSHHGHLVASAGGEDLADGEIVAALLNYQEGHRSSEMRSRAKVQGDAHLAALAADRGSRKH